MAKQIVQRAPLETRVLIVRGALALMLVAATEPATTERQVPETVIALLALTRPIVVPVILDSLALRAILNVQTVASTAIVTKEFQVVVLVFVTTALLVPHALSVLQVELAQIVI